MIDDLVLPDRSFEMRNGIPRFVEDVGYAESFGEQWQRYRRVQLDSETGKTLSRDRLVRGTGWTPEELEGELVLEAGCGAGRFTEVLLECGARVVAVDASSAVDACRETCSDHPDLMLAQADLFALPFRPGSFDRVFCYGVLQHTPDPEAAFRVLVEQLRPGGVVAADVYKHLEYIDRWNAKRLWRPLTARLPRNVLRRIVEWYIPRWLPIDNKLKAVPGLGRFLVSVIPCWNPRGLYDELTWEEQVAWTVLDTYDALAPTYDKPQSLEDVRRWCEHAGLEDVDVHFGGNGIEVNAKRPLRST